MKILVNRTGALGDVIQTTPIIRQLAQAGHTVAVRTAYPDVFLNNPHVTVVNGAFGWDRLVDLDLAYEKRPHTHMLDAYEIEAFGLNVLGPGERQPELFVNPCIQALARQRRAVIHAAVSWPSRTLHPAFWNDVYQRLTQRQFIVQFVGTMRDYAPHGAGIADIRGRTTLHELAQVITGADVVIASDSAIIHVTGCTETPLVGLFTSVNPAYRMPYRKAPGIALTPNLPCIGCLAEQTPPATYLTCHRGDNACVQLGAFDPEDVARQASVLADAHRNA